MEKLPEKLTRLAELKTMLRYAVQGLDEEIETQVRELANLRGATSEHAQRRGLGEEAKAMLDREAEAIETRISDLRTRRASTGSDLSRLATTVDRLQEYCREHGIGVHARAAASIPGQAPPPAPASPPASGEVTLNPGRTGGAR